MRHLVEFEVFVFSSDLLVWFTPGWQYHLQECLCMYSQQVNKCMVKQYHYVHIFSCIQPYLFLMKRNLFPIVSAQIGNCL